MKRGHLKQFKVNKVTSVIVHCDMMFMGMFCSELEK